MVTTTALPTALTSTRLAPWLGAACVALALAVAVSPIPTALLALTLLMGCGVLLLPYVAQHDRASIGWAVVLGLVLRIAMILILRTVYATPENPDAILFRDAEGYHRVGTGIAADIRAGTEFRVEYHTSTGEITFHRFMGYLYAWLGTSVWVPRLLNAVLGALSVLLTYLLARPIAGDRAARWAAWMYALWTTAIFWSSQILKDMPIGFLLLLGSLLWVRFVRSHNLLWLLASALVIAPLFYLRIYIFGFFYLGLYVTFLIHLFKHGKAPIAIFLIAGMALGWQLPFKLGWVEDPAIMLFKLSYSDDPFAGDSMITAIATRGLGYHTIFGLSLIKFLLSPLPWNTAGIDHWVVPGVIAQYAILPFAVRGGWILMRRHLLYVLPFIITTVLTDLLYAVVFLGAIPRHMHMFYPYMFLCAAAGMQGWRHWALPVCGFLACLALAALTIA